MWTLYSYKRASFHKIRSRPTNKKEMKFTKEIFSLWFLLFIDFMLIFLKTTIISLVYIKQIYVKINKEYYRINQIKVQLENFVSY